MKLKARKHIVEIYLKYVGIRYTPSFLREKIFKHPFARTFAGIQDILLDYHIRSLGIKMEVEELFRLNEPFITLIGKRFVVVEEMTEQGCRCMDESNESATLPLADFKKLWCGSILLPEVREESEEDDFLKHYVLGLANAGKVPFGGIAVLVVFCFLLHTSGQPLSGQVILLLILYFLGIIASLILVREGLDMNNPLIRRLCESPKKRSCATVLQSKAAQFWGILKWSEIGLGYFTACFLFLVLFPGHLGILFLLNLLSLPYTVWSVAYQWKVAEKWCPFCLAVQLLFWLLFFVFISGHSSLFSVSWSEIVSFGLVCMVVTVGMWWLLPLCGKARQSLFLERRLTEIKSDESVFQVLLYREKYFDAEAEARTLVLGNPSATATVSIISDPYCWHCAAMFETLERLLGKYRDRVRVELLFAGDEALEPTIRYLIAIFLKYGSEKAEKIYSEWFILRDKIKEKYPVEAEDERTGRIYKAQHFWSMEAKKEGTPLIYFDQYRLPDFYVLEDIKYFL